MATKVIDVSGKALDRSSNSGVAFVNFEAFEFSYLNITSFAIELFQVNESCGYACLQNPSCFSYNLAVYPDINGKLLCELLPSDKYNNSNKFVPSQVFRHFSVAVRLKSLPYKQYFNSSNSFRSSMVSFRIVDSCI